MAFSMSRSAWIVLGVLAIHTSSLGSLAAAEGDDNQGCPDKSQYTLFNPTPSKCMREFEPDRPDLTNNPFTVDAGHVQLESDLFNYSLSRPDQDGTVTEKFLFGSTNVRVGITNNTELQFLLQPFNAVRTRFKNPAMTTWDAGPDVLEITGKYNFYGNDTFEKPGATALGIIPFVDIPTVHNGVGGNDVEGGVDVPFAIKLSDKAELELMTEYDFIKNSQGSGYHVEYFNSGSFSYEFTPKFSAYVEVATLFGNEDPSGGIVTIGTGLLYQPNGNTQIDVGSNFGVTPASDRINPFVGVTKRF
ncbi:MAG TPA: transporter [Rhizobiales bacterium]|jgi:Putative MetA-pathway of phenol degradation|nr:transporter [Hyphomicrobiales bacterium]